MTYHISVSDSLDRNIRQTFRTHAAATSWMQQQLDRLLRQIVVVMPKAEKQKTSLSDCIKSLSNVPPCYVDMDYKNTITTILADKYESIS